MLEISTIIVIVAVAGTVMRIWEGMIGKPIRALKPNKVLYTAVLSSLGGIIMVTPVFTGLPESASNTYIMHVAITQVMAIAGLDELIHRSKKLGTMKPLNRA